jgi:cephalosporin-C deacetylase-like acetyl esterase
MRMDDIIRSVNYLSHLPQVDASHIIAIQGSPYQTEIVFAALIDPRISMVFLHMPNPLPYQSIVDTELHRNAPEVALPGVLQQFDLNDIELALGMRMKSIAD